MPSIITNDFRITTTTGFAQLFNSNISSIYLGIGRALPWINESVPDNPSGTTVETFQIWDEMAALKKVVGTNIAFGAKRYNWTQNTVYDEYRNNYGINNPAASGATNLDEAIYYVVTRNGQVFKCISNNNNSASTVEPTGESLFPITTADNYIWKYMYTISPGEDLKFSTVGFIPILENIQVKNSAIAGSILHAVVIDGGIGYIPNATIPMFVNGNGQLNDTASGAINAFGGNVVSVNVVNGGSNYGVSETDIPVLIRQIGSTTNETAFGLARSNASGQLVSVEVAVEGINYNNGPVQIISSSCRPFGTTNENGTFTKVLVGLGAEGNGFTSATITPLSMPSAAGRSANIEAVISPFGGHGFDAVTELSGLNVIVAVRLEGEEFDGIEEGDFPIVNDFRRIVLVQDPTLFGNPTIATSSTLDALYGLTISNLIGEFLPDEKIFGNASGASATIVDYKPDQMLLKYTQTPVEKNILFQQFETVVGEQSGAQATVSMLNNPEVQPYSGKIIYVNNRTAISRDENQVEDVKLVFSF